MKVRLICRHGQVKWWTRGFQHTREIRCVDAEPPFLEFSKLVREKFICAVYGTAVNEGGDGTELLARARRPLVSEAKIGFQDPRLVCLGVLAVNKKRTHRMKTEES